MTPWAAPSGPAEVSPWAAPSRPAGLSPLAQRFLQAYCSLGARLSGASALVEAVREIGWFRRITLSSGDRTIVWDRDSLPSVSVRARDTSHDEPANAVTLRVLDDAGNGKTTVLSLELLSGRSLTREERDDLDRLLHYAAPQAATDDGAYSDSLRLPLALEDDLGFLHRRLDESYRLFRKVASALVHPGRTFSETQPYSFFLLYEPRVGGLMYPVADFYRFTPDGWTDFALRIEQHGLEDALLAGDQRAAELILREIFVEGLNEVLGSPAFQLTGHCHVADRDGIVAAPSLVLDDRSRRVLKFLNERTSRDVARSAVAQWRSRWHPSLSLETSAEKLLQTALRQLPQGLSVGFATRCFVTGTSFLFQNSQAREQWKTGNPVLLHERLLYGVIEAIERHFFLGRTTMARSLGAVSKAPDDSVIAVAPMVARGQPIGVFYAIESIEHDVRSSRDVGELAMLFCQQNAAAAAELAQRARNMNFVRKVQNALTKEGALTTALESLKNVVAQRLHRFLNVVPGSVLVKRDGTDDVFTIEINEERLLELPPDAACRLPRARVSLPSLALPDGQTVTIEMVLETEENIARGHEYEWASTLSSAFSHIRTRDQTASWAYLAVPYVSPHMYAKEGFRVISVKLAAAAESLDAASVDVRVVNVIRNAAWICDKFAHKRAGHPAVQNVGLTEVDPAREFRIAVATTRRMMMPEEGQPIGDHGYILDWLDGVDLRQHQPRVQIRCKLCLEYALVEAFRNAIKATEIPFAAGQPLEGKAIDAEIIMDSNSTSFIVSNWLGTEPRGFQRDKLRRVSKFLRDHPMPHDSSESFLRWRESYAQTFVGSSGGIVDDLGWCVSLHGGKLSLELENDHCKMILTLPR